MRFIVVDGIDGSGKSTVAEWIVQYYHSRGESVMVQTHPSDRCAGRLARRFLQGDGIGMYILSSAFYMLDVLASVSCLRQWKKVYDNVVFVRYLMGTAYLPKRYTKLAYDIFAGTLPIPERLLLVDAEPRMALRRIASRRGEIEMFENLPALTRVRDKMLDLSSDWEVLNNNGSETESRRRLEEILERWE